MTNFTEKQQKYIDARVAGLKPGQAAKMAGYSASTAAKQAHTIEARADVQSAIKKGKASLGTTRKQGRPPKDGDDAAVMKDKYPNSLAVMQDMYNNPRLPYSVRFEAAKVALPYEHGRIAETGKKEKAKEEAHKKAKGGKFAVPSAPNVTPIRRQG